MGVNANQEEERELRSLRYTVLGYSNAFFGPLFGLWMGNFLYPIYCDLDVPIDVKIVLIFTTISISSGFLIGIFQLKKINSNSNRTERIKSTWINLATIIFFSCIIIMSNHTLPDYASMANFGVLYFIWWYFVLCGIALFI